MQGSNGFPWKNGFYQMPSSYRFHAVKVEGNNGAVKFVLEPDMVVSLRTGNFEYSDYRGLNESGENHYNVEVSTTEPGVSNFFAVVHNNGNTWTFSDGVSGEWMSEDTFKNIKEDTDPCDAYPCDYIPNPDSSGKLLWISGFTGTGKSTVSLYLKNEFDFILYEGDCFAAGFNPYVGSAPKATTPHGTRKLSGIPQKRTLICEKFLQESITNVKSSCPVEPDVCKEFYELMCDDIIKERTKFGGNWVINHGLYTKLARDIVKKKLGSKLQLIVLTISSEHQAKRYMEANLKNSTFHNDDMYNKMLEEKRLQIEVSKRGYESVNQNESNILEISITDKMTVHDVSKTIMNSIS